MQNTFRRKILCGSLRLVIILLIFALPFHAFSQAPTVNFSADVVSGCTPLVVNFRDLSTNNPTTWSWDFGNGTSSVKNPTATYFTPGTYTVKLTATNSSGSSTSSKDNYITIYALPSVNFSAIDIAGCAPLRSTFTDLSTAGSGTIAQWEWNFGDAGTSTSANPAHTYAPSGTYGVFLKVTNSFGCTKTASKSQFIKVASTPSAAFTASVPLYCSFPVNVSFANTANAGNVVYSWNFGDGNTSNQQSPVYAYTSSGSYNVTLITTNVEGCSDTVVKPITLGPKSINFSGPDSICVSTKATFSVTSNPAPTSVKWDMGDGTIYQTPVVNHTFSSSGIYAVKMVGSFPGCTDTVSKNVVVRAAPQIDFIANATASCKAPFTVNFQGRASGITKWQWNFGDSTVDANQNPTHTYNNNGKYTVTLTATTADGCTATTQKVDFINVVAPSASISNLPAGGCVPFTFTPAYTINNVDGVASYSWDFGDGFTTTNAQPSHTYTSTGSYTIKLTYATNGGCKDTITMSKAVNVGDATAVDFTVDTTQLCSSHLLKFIPVVSVPVSSYVWDFGDGATSNQQTPLHRYVDTGYYSVTLSVNYNGCVSLLKKDKAVRIDLPIARFDFQKFCTRRDSVSFTAKSLNATSVKWNFGDGVTSTETNVSHVYKSDGNYQVMLVVTDGRCTDTIIRNVPIWLGKPTLKTDVTAVCKGGRVVFNFNHPSPANVVSYNWNYSGDVNDGFITTTNNPVGWNYNKTGSYSFIGYTEDAFGCFDTVSIRDLIKVTGPTANFGSAFTKGCSGTIINFSDSSVADATSAIKKWTWDFGDGVIRDYTSQPFSHKYDSAGTYSVKLLVTDNTGCADSVQKSSFVTINAGKANFSANDSATCVGANINFVNQSTGSALSYIWKFGDGSSSNLQNPAHAYAATGIYAVKLIISAASGCVDSLERNNYITVNNPKARFKLSDSVASCPPAEIKFRDTSVYVRSWQWKFGDGNTSSVPNPVNVFFNPGTYNVQLIVTSAGGCQDTAVKKIVVAGPTGTLTYSPLKGCSPLQATFKANNIVGAFDFTWDFGDGISTTTTDSSTTHTYSSAGKYYPKVLLKDAKGCIVPYAAVDTIFVEKIKPVFTAATRIFCDTGTVAFTDSTVTLGSITRTWYFGGGATSTAKNPVHKYTFPGVFDVRLVIQSSFGCVDSITYPAYIKVVNSPVATIVASDTICSGSINFTAGLAADTSKIASWLWKFDNGQSSSIQNPPTQTFSNGNYVNTLTVTNSSGCSTTVAKPLSVFAVPVLRSTPDTTICEGSTAGLIVSGGTSYSWSSVNVASLSCTNCNNPVVSPTGNSTYYVKGTSANGCSSFDTVNVSVFNKYTLSATSAYKVCAGSRVQLNATGAPNYMWSPSLGLSAVNIANPFASPTTSTTYKVIGYDSLGCFTDSAVVSANVFNYPTVDLGPDITIAVGNTITLNPTVSSDVVNYRWDPASNLSCSNCQTPVLLAKSDATYKLIVTTAAGCSAEDTVHVIVSCNGSSVFVPNTFSPNGDGVNDVFYPRGKGVYTISAFRIYNRWGEIVFDKKNIAANDAAAGWDGTYKGKLAESGVYTYYVEVLCNNSQVLKYLGNINLIQ